VIPILVSRSAVVLTRSSLQRRAPALAGRRSDRKCAPIRHAPHMLVDEIDVLDIADQDLGVPQHYSSVPHCALS
jgi:hypothetical protein